MHPLRRVSICFGKEIGLVEECCYLFLRGAEQYSWLYFN